MRNTEGEKGQIRPEGTKKTRRDKQGKKGQTRPKPSTVSKSNPILEINGIIATAQSIWVKSFVKKKLKMKLS